jgi:outer membrane protein OmpA-like peptidoglycan-associated protein
VAPAARPARAQDGEIGGGVRLRLPYAVWATELSPAAQADLEALAREVGGNDRIRLRLAAYANAGAGSAAKARRTSLARALAVRGFLIERGIKGGRIDLRALGHTAGAAEADRVDVVVADK